MGGLGQGLGGSVCVESGFLMAGPGIYILS